jgi:hypothetical protein
MGVTYEVGKENSRAASKMTGASLMKYYAQLRHMIGFIVLAVGLCSAQASTAVYEDFQVVSGDTTSTTPIAIAQAGTYKATLVDFAFPVPFDVLALGITQNLNPLGIGFGTGTFTFNVPAPGTLLAHLAAFPGQGGLGTYGVEITAIPLPASAILFASAMIGLVFVGRRKKL